MVSKGNHPQMALIQVNLPSLVGLKMNKLPVFERFGALPSFEIFQMSWVLKNPSVAPFDPVVTKKILKHMLKLGDGKVAATYLHFFLTYGCVWKCCVALNPMVLLIIIPFLNGYFIGNINPTFSDKVICISAPRFLPVAVRTPWRSWEEIMGILLSLASYHLLIPALANKKPWIPYLYIF